MLPSLKDRDKEAWQWKSMHDCDKESVLFYSFSVSLAFSAYKGQTILCVINFHKYPVVSNWQMAIDKQLQLLFKQPSANTYDVG